MFPVKFTYSPQETNENESSTLNLHAEPIHVILNILTSC